MAALPLTIQPDGAPVLDVRVNNVVVPMLVDTGYRRTVLTRTETDRQQLPLIHTKTLGHPDVLTAQPDEVFIGTVRAHKTYFTVIDYEPVKKYSGIVGADYLLQADLEIALADKKMSIFKGEGCDDKSLAYWDSEAQETRLDDTSKYSAAFVTVKLNGKTKLALIDTGAPYSMVSLQTARNLDVTPESVGVVPVADFVRRDGRTDSQWNAPFESFAIGDETIAGPHFAIVDSLSRGFDSPPGIVLGRDFLRAHRVLLAFGQKRMYFSYLGGQVFTPPEAALGN